MLAELLHSFRDIVIGPNLDERRVTPRARCNIALSCQASDGATVCSLKDLSSTGARILSDRKFSRKRILLLAPPKGMGANARPLKTQVAWCRSTREGYLVGLRFQGAASGWALTILRELGLSPSIPTTQRRFVRVPGDMKVKLQAQGFEKIVLLQDLSIGGALLVCRDQLPKAEAVRLLLPTEMDLPGLQLLAATCGCRSGENGYEISVKFADMTDKQKKVLVKYLSYLMRRSFGR